MFNGFKYSDGVSEFDSEDVGQVILAEDSKRISVNSMIEENLE